MDDLIVIGFSENDHVNSLRKVFEACRRCNLKLNPLKCHFFRTEVSFLGHVCTDHGLKPDPKKVSVMERYPRPHDKDAVRRFVAFANYYRRFVENFAGLTKPLTTLTKKTVEFAWSDDCEAAFQTLKQKLSSAPILKYPDFTKPFNIITDASDIACGGVLTQRYDDMDMPVVYASKAFNKHEKNKPPIEKELLAVHYAITQFRPYIYGRHFTVYSDHKPLAYLYNLKNPSSRLSRIRLNLEEYDFEIIYIKGKDNVIADALSRVSINDLKEQSPEAQILAVTRSMSRKERNEGTCAQNVIERQYKINVFEDFNTGFSNKLPRLKTKTLHVDKKTKKIVQIVLTASLGNTKVYELDLVNERANLTVLFSKLQDAAIKLRAKTFQIPRTDQLFQVCTLDDFKSVGNRILKTLTIAIIKPPKLVTDKTEKLELMKKFHDDPLFGGHSGQRKLHAKLKNEFYWKGMTKDIKSYLQECKNCKTNKHTNYTKEEMVITETPDKPFDVVIIDTIGPLTTSNRGNSYAVTMICDLTKFLVCAPIVDKSAKEVAKAIFERFILTFGPMKSIRTDRGKEYTNETITELCKLMGVDHKISAAYHHESVGAIERNHREFNRYLSST